ncbi:MAG: hypothetical protein B6D61_02865 [Bacteroidetes bacterium 4484_249]|nr:MAG: hypothetical protein B6D61_02865 [Bacteroidetes bacterium 4484_249]
MNKNKSQIIHNLVSIVPFVFLFFIILDTNISMGAADGYKIKIQINGIADTVCYLANYYGDKTYLTDTAYVDKKGRFVFEGDSVLPGGIYIVAGQNNNRYFELIIDKEQQFAITTDLSDITGKMKFDRSFDNTLFFDYINNNITNRKKIASLKKSKEEFVDMPDSMNNINRQIQDINNNLEKYQTDIIENNPESFVSVLLKAMKDPEVINIPVLENGREDSVYAYQYYKQHFWDNFDLTDDRLLRTPLFNKRIKRYFTSVIFQHPDTITKEADIFIDKTRDNKEVFKYSVWYLTYKFETSKIMGFDEIFVHMVDNYYAKGEAYWADSSVVKSLSERADALRPILIGKTAPELILIDTAGSFVSLHHTPAKYMVVFFYEVDCGHCKKENKALKSWYDNNDIGFEVFAVCTDTSLVKWKKFINKNDMNWVNVNGTRSITPDYHDLYDIRVTPTLFLLDDKKNIIAKRLKTEQLIPFLENYNKNKQPEE